MKTTLSIVATRCGKSIGRNISGETKNTRTRQATDPGVFVCTNIFLPENL